MADEDDVPAVALVPEPLEKLPHPLVNLVERFPSVWPRRCIDHPDYHFVIVYGVSNNLRSRWDNSNVEFLGYRPEDDSEVFAAEIFAEGKKENDISAQFHGAHYCPMEFSGDTSRIE